jgi:hypothetical protein
VSAHIDVEQRRARLGVRHRLATRARADGPEAVAASLVALHATDPATVHLAAGARMRRAPGADLERALYDDRTLLRLLGMRRTMFVVTLDCAPVVQAACSVDIARTQRKLLERHLGEQGHPENVAEPARWLAEVQECTLAALAARGSATARELSEDVPGLRQRLRMAPGKPYEAIGNITSRVLFLLAVEGRIVRGRPRGSWTSTQYRWSGTETWLGGGMPVLGADEARAELARRWLAAYGPAPVADLRWWTGWTAGQVRKALTAVDPVEVDLDGAAGVALPGDVEPVPPPDPWVALLPALDPSAMGWAERDWFLGGHRAPLFDRSGNIGPTVWCEGRVVGGWAHRQDGEVRVRLLEDVGADARAGIEAEAQRLEKWLGKVRVVPRFRTPLERELTS